VGNGGVGVLTFIIIMGIIIIGDFYFFIFFLLVKIGGFFLFKGLLIRLFLSPHRMIF
jgi:hypothetical protein